MMFFFKFIGFTESDLKQRLMERDRSADETMMRARTTVVQAVASACLHRLGSLSSCRNSSIPPCLPDLALRMCRSRCQSCCTCTGFAVLATHTYIILISIDQATAALNLRTELNGEEAGRERKAGRRRRCKASLVFLV